MEEGGREGRKLCRIRLPTFEPEDLDGEFRRNCSRNQRVTGVKEVVTLPLLDGVLTLRLICLTAPTV